MAKPERLDSPPARRGKRYAMILFVAFAAVFIVLSTWQVAAQVFAPHSTEVAPSSACAAAARAFEGAVDSALHHAGGAHDPGEAQDLFWSALGHGEPLSQVERKCVAPGADLDTFVSARRLQEAAERSAMDESASLARLRRSLETRAPQISRSP